MTPEMIIPGEDDYSVFKETLQPDGDGSHCGITDLYDDWRELLEGKFEKGALFEATWASKKELWSAQIQRRPEAVIVTAWCFCDEGDDLISDAVWEVYQDQDKLNSIMENEELLSVIQGGCDAHCGPMLGEVSYESSDSLPATATLENCLLRISDLMGDSEKQSNQNFEDLKDLVKWTVDHLEDKV